MVFIIYALLPFFFFQKKLINTNIHVTLDTLLNCSSFLFLYCYHIYSFEHELIAFPPHDQATPTNQYKTIGPAIPSCNMVGSALGRIQLFFSSQQLLLCILKTPSCKEYSIWWLHGPMVHTLYSVTARQFKKELWHFSLTMYHANS